MSWFKRTNKNINTKTEEKKDIPAGLWYKTPTGKVIETKELAENMYVSPCLLYTSPSPRDFEASRMPSSA